MNVILYYLAVFFGAYTVLTALLALLALSVPRAAFFARCLAMYLTFFLSAVFGTVSSAVLTALGRQSIAPWLTARTFHHVARVVTGTSFVVIDDDDDGGGGDNLDPAHQAAGESSSKKLSGREILAGTRPAVFVGNHQTELDVLMLGALFPKHCSVTGKRSLRNIPFLGWFMSLSGAIFIDRGNSRDARQAMAGAAREMRARRQSVYMFPEGTRSYAAEPTLLPFKKGAFHLAVEAGVPIVPCVVANYSHILWPKDYVFRAGTVPIKILDPIPTKHLTSADVDELTRTTRELMLRELIALTAKARGQPVPPTSTPSVAAATNTNLDSTATSSAIDI